LGDVAFLYGVLLTYHLYGTLDFDLLFTRAAEAPEMLALWPGGLEISAITVITLVIFIGAMAKSAQFPLHAWLPDTMDTPTPVSALMHAGIVNAGGFLLNRLAPLYGLSSTTLHIVFVIGGLTTLLGASMMLLQNDIKKTLGFSTMGQMGYMIMECGLGAFALAIFHLIAHGMFKATHFLNAGQVIHAARREPKRPHAGGIRERTPFSRLTWLTGAALTLILPLIILLTAHEVWSVPLRDAQGAVIFLFFGWVTASQTIFSLYRLNAVASWKVAGAMMFALLFIGFTYLWAGEAFTYFLYPAPDVVAQFFQAAALPTWLFDLLVVLTTMMIVIVWAILYAKAQGKHVPLPSWVTSMMPALYVLFMNRLYIDALYAKLGYGIIRLCHRLESRW
ncbi:MAG: NADH-quinone oxidoreductase subunit L, partial [Nitrospiraceae bacterium]